MRYLVSGAQGFVGRYVVAELLREDSTAYVLGVGRSAALDEAFTHSLRTGRIAHAPLPINLAREFVTVNGSRYQYRSVDLRDAPSLERTLSASQPDCVVHLASGLRGDDSLELVRTNIEGTTALVSALTRLPVPKPRFVLGSSGGVYGSFSAEDLPLSEDHPCKPMDVYSCTKLAAEQIACIVGRAHGVPVAIARIFNVVGPGQDERHVCGRLAAELQRRRSAGLLEPLHVGDLAATRDFIDVRDVARAIVRLTRAEVPDGLYNVGSGIETAVRDVLHQLMACAGVTPRIESKALAVRDSGVPRHCADMTKLRALGFAPRFTLERSLADLFAYYEGLSAVGNSG